MLSCFHALKLRMIQSQPLLNLLGTVQKTIHNRVWFRQEWRVRGLAGVCDGILAQHRRKLLLNGVEQSSVILAVEIHALHVLPRLVRNLVPEYLSGLVLELGDGLLLQLGRHIVVEDVLGGLGDDTLTLCQLSVTKHRSDAVGSGMRLGFVSPSHLEVHPRERLSAQHLQNRCAFGGDESG